MKQNSSVHRRPLTSEERSLTEFLLDSDFRGSEALLEQLKFAEAIDARGTVGDPTVDFWVPRDNAPPARVSRSIPIEARGSAADGMDINVPLHVQDGYLTELEIYRSVLEGDSYRLREARRDGRRNSGGATDTPYEIAHSGIGRIGTQHARA